MKPTISSEILKDRGYIEYNKENHGERFFQKKFTDEKGIKYFIDCKYYFFTQPKTYEQLTFWDFSMQLETEKSSVNFTTVQWFNQDGTSSQNAVQDVENYFESLWQFHKQPYYERYS